MLLRSEPATARKSSRASGIHAQAKYYRVLQHGDSIPQSFRNLPFRLCHVASHHLVLKNACSRIHGRERTAPRCSSPAGGTALADARVLWESRRSRSEERRV